MRFIQRTSPTYSVFKANIVFVDNGFITVESSYILCKIGVVTFMDILSSLKIVMQLYNFYFIFHIELTEIFILKNQYVMVNLGQYFGGNNAFPVRKRTDAPTRAPILANSSHQRPSSTNGFAAPNFKAPLILYCSRQTHIQSHTSALFTHPFTNKWTFNFPPSSAWISLFLSLTLVLLIFCFTFN